MKRSSPLRRTTPMARGAGPTRKSRTVGTPKYRRKEWRERRERIIREAGGRCQLDHPGCEFEARTVHHTAYGRGRGLKKLMDVPDSALIACCWSCHKVEDPWLGNGFGLGSRERNARARHAEATVGLGSADGEAA